MNLVASLTLGALAAFAIGFGVQTYRLERLETKHTTYVAKSEALGEEAQRRADAEIAAAKRAKELSDAENAASVSSLNATVRRLRQQVAAGGGLSAATPSTGGAAGTCYDPAELTRALRGLDEGVLGLLEQGEKAVRDLNTAKRWAQGR